MANPEIDNADIRETQQITAALELARLYTYDAGHAEQVTRLSLMLFDALPALHQLGPTERHWLRLAGILHDIGVMEGARGHHKASLRIILSASLLPFTSKERLIVGSVARYHRRALPSPEHDHFAVLSPDEQESVSKLAALLRIGDGLDVRHQNRVSEIAVKVKPGQVILTCREAAPAGEERAAARLKADLFERAYGRRVEIRKK